MLISNFSIISFIKTYCSLYDILCSGHCIDIKLKRRLNVSVVSNSDITLLYGVIFLNNANILTTQCSINSIKKDFN